MLTLVEEGPLGPPAAAELASRASSKGISPLGAACAYGGAPELAAATVRINVVPVVGPCLCVCVRVKGGRVYEWAVVGVGGKSFRFCPVILTSLPGTFVVWCTSR